MNEEQLSKKQQKRLERIKRKEQEKKSYSRSKLGRSISIWAFLIIILLALVWGLVWLVDSSSEKDSLLDGNISAISSEDWTKGNPQAKVELIEYSDFQCPACASYFPIVTRINEEFEEDILFAYRHFPLRSVHPHAQLAAQAAEAAGQQDKFWQMHDLLFQNQPTWSRQLRPKESFLEYAEELDLDLEKFETDLESNETEEIVNEAFSRARAAGLNSTPSFILNGQLISNPRSIEEFRSIIQSALANATTSSSTDSE